MSTLNQLVQVISTLIPNEKLVLVDVGASGGLQSRWLPFAPLLKTIGFEPNPLEFQKLHSSETEHWLNVAIAGKEGPRLIHLTRNYNNSSLLMPNRDVIERLEWSNDFDVVSEVEMHCVTLDGATSKHHPHFLKLDTQGSEHEILMSSESILNEDLVMIEVEVSFCELYEDQALFADVDRLIRAAGFYLQDLANLLLVKPRGRGGVGGPKGQLIQADALYYKKPALLCKAGSDRVAAALISYLAYGYPELGLQLLDLLANANREILCASKIRSLLHSMRHSSAFLSWVPKLDFIARCFKRLWLGTRPVSHSLWETELGNRIG